MKLLDWYPSTFSGTECNDINRQPTILDYLTPWLMTQSIINLPAPIWLYRKSLAIYPSNSAGILEYRVTPFNAICSFLGTCDIPHVTYPTISYSILWINKNTLPIFESWSLDASWHKYFTNFGFSFSNLVRSNLSEQYIWSDVRCFQQ